MDNLNIIPFILSHTVYEGRTGQPKSCTFFKDPLTSELHYSIYQLDSECKEWWIRDYLTNNKLPRIICKGSRQEALDWCANHWAEHE